MKVLLSTLEEKKYEVVNESGNVVSVDMLEPADKQHQSPMELLLSALVSCAAVDIVGMIKKRRKTLVDMKGEASGTRKTEHPRGYTEIHLKYTLYSPDLTEEEAERIVALATTKYCSVAATVSAEQTHSFEIIRP